MREQCPVPVDRKRRVGFVARQQRVDRLPRGVERGIVERAFGEDRRIACGNQEDIAVAQRHVEPLGEMKHHLARGRGTPGFDKAQVARGNLRLAGEIELAQMTALAPLAQVFADGFGWC